MTKNFTEKLKRNYIAKRENDVKFHLTVVCLLTSAEIMSCLLEDVNQINHCKFQTEKVLSQTEDKGVERKLQFRQ